MKDPPSVQYTVPCGLCGWKYITSVQYTVQYSTLQYSTLQYSTQYSTCGWKYITSVQYRFSDFWSRKEAAELGKIFTSTNSTHTLIRRLGIEKKQQFSKSFQNL